MKETIICSVADLFRKYGIRSVSMDDIAHHQGISKKTLYQNFDDKNNLVSEVTTMLLEQMMKDYALITQAASDAIDELYSISKLMRRHIKALNPALMYDLQKYHPDSWDLFRKHENEVVFYSVADNLQRGINECYYRAEINVNVLAKIRVEQIHSSFDENIFPKDQYEISNVQIQLFDHFVHGLLTESGLELYKNYQKQNDE